MTRDDAAAFAAELTLTAELFGAALSDARVTAYFQALEDVPWEDLQPAMVAARQVERFFPSPAMLRDLTGPTLDVLAASAFADVWACAGGRANRDRLEQAALDTVEAMGGWGTFREARTGTGSILSAQFRKLYVAYARDLRVTEARQRAIEAGPLMLPTAGLERQP